MTQHYVKTCPFCAETPTLQKWHGGPTAAWLISCDEDSCPASPQVHGATQKEAVKRWNTRDEILSWITVSKP